MTLQTPARYFDAVRGILHHLESTQLPVLERAADMVVKALLSGGTVNCSEIGHGLQGDFINRAGGLCAVQPFSFHMNVTNPLPKCRAAVDPEADNRDLERVRAAIRQSNLRAGDVMLLSSVSGRNRGPVELALGCREIGVGTIGLTSFTYTERVKSLHPSGKRLREAVDVAIDIGAPYGDAGVEVPGYESALIPMSGLGQDAAGWLLWGMVMEKTAAAGSPASILISHNRDGGPEHNDRTRATYQQRGY